MVVSDPIADMLAQITNGYLAQKASINLSWSRTREALSRILVGSGYLADMKKEETNGHSTLILALKYNDRKPAISSIKRVSRPSLRVYVKHSGLPKVLGGLGIAVISTPQGLMTDSLARKKGLGGEVICEIS